MEFILDFLLQLSAGERGLYLLVLVFLIYKGIIKLPFVKINQKTKTHDKCPLYPDHKRLIREAIKRAEETTSAVYSDSIKQLKKEHEKDKEILQLRDKNNEIIRHYKQIDILMEQMSVLSIKQTLVMSLMLDSYFKINQSTSQNKAYHNLLLRPKSNIKNMVRQWLRRNGYAEKSIAEFELYKTEHVDLMIGSVTDYLNNNYMDADYDVSRARLKHENINNIVPQIKVIYSKMFDECRNISIRYKDKITALNNEVLELERSRNNE